MSNLNLSIDQKIIEYQDVSANLRHYSDARFKRLALYLIVEAALFNFAYQKNSTLEPLAIAVCGVVTTIAFWVMTHRAAKYYWGIRKRATDLELEIGYKQYSSLKSRSSKTQKTLNTSNGVYCIHFAFIVLWLFFAFSQLNLFKGVLSNAESTDTQSTEASMEGSQD